MAIKLFETIKKVFTSEENNQVSSVHNCCDCKHVPMVDEKKLQEEGNIDKAQITKNNKRNDIYNRLEEICAEYRMDLETLKKMNFLEEICGKSLETLNETEVENVLSALQNTLYFDFKAFWKDRDENDITEIMQKTKRQYNRDKLGATRFGQVVSDFTTESTLKEELVNTGIIDKNTDLSSLSDEEFKLKVRQYFKQEIIGDTEGCSEKQLKRKYARAAKHFAYFVNKFETPKEKELLAAAIAEMSSDNVVKSSDVLIRSCGCNTECKAHVAKSVYDSVDVTAKDAFGKTINKEDAREFFYITYNNMNETDSRICAEKCENFNKTFTEENSEKIKAIKEKQNAGIQLEAWEEDLLTIYNNKVVAQTAGATAGISQNINLSQESIQEITTSLLNNAKDCNIDKEVLSAVAEYVSKNPEKFAKMSKQEFTQMLDKITDGKYSQTVANLENNENKNNVTKKSKQNGNEVSETKNTEYKNTVSETKSEENSKKTHTNINTTATVTTPKELKNGSRTYVNTQEKPISDTNQNTTKTTDVETKEETKTSFIHKDITSYIRAEGKIKGVNKYIEEYGKREGIAEAIDNIDQTNKKYVEKLYKQQNSAEQLNIIRNSGTDLKIPLAWTDDSTILKLDGEILSCHYATKQAQDAIEEIREG